MTICKKRTYIRVYVRVLCWLFHIPFRFLRNITIRTVGNAAREDKNHKMLELNVAFKLD